MMKYPKMRHMQHTSSSHAHESAETLALEVLTWIAGRENLMAAFLGSTGLLYGDLRSRVDDPVVLGGVLDFLLEDGQRLELFCAETGKKPETIAKSRFMLPGCSPETGTVEVF